MKIPVKERVLENVHIRELFSLRDRVALVTGGAGRYGRQICYALTEAGATVVVASRNRDKCEAFVEELHEADCEAAALRLDITDRESLLSAMTTIEARWGRLDILFNNAVAVRAVPVAEHSVDDWARAMDANSTALYQTIRVFGEMMAKRNAGSIVNIASIYGLVSPDFRIYEGCAEMTNPPSYGFAKAGMIQLTRYFAVRFAPHLVRVNCISPGGLFSEAMPSRFVDEYVRRTPLGRMAGANDLKGAAVFLASDASAYVTGTNLLVDGGYTAL